MRQPWSVSTAAQEAGVAAIQETDRVEKTRRYVAKRTQMDGAADGAAWNILYSVGSELYVVSWKRRSLGTDAGTTEILIRDCSNYDGLSKGDYRVAVRTREENVRLFQALTEVVLNGKGDHGTGNNVQCQEKVCLRRDFAGFLNRTDIKWRRLNPRIWR